MSPFRNQVGMGKDVCVTGRGFTMETHCYTKEPSSFKRRERTPTVYGSFPSGVSVSGRLLVLRTIYLSISTPCDLCFPS